MKNYLQRMVQKYILIGIVLVAIPQMVSSTRQMEKLDRGVLAVKVSGGVYISWRLLGDEDQSTEFNVYRDGTLLNAQALDGATNYTDASGTVSNTYTIAAVLGGEEVNTSRSTEVWAKYYKTIQLSQPAGGVTEPTQYGSVGKDPKGSFPDGQSYTYSPNDCSVADLDGDGEYEVIVKWDPSNSEDNSYYGITGKVYIDAYKLDGTQLWRIDMGKNIRAGAHYTQFLVYDFDGDGKAEMVCKTAPGTVDGEGNNVIMNSDDPTADYRNLDYTQTKGSAMLGIVINGPEYLTLFDGVTGAELNSIDYEPARGSVSGWGDSYGNRSERYLACVAYLDGVHPSAVMCRGYYKRTTLAAYDIVDKKFQKRWLYDSNNYSSVPNAAGQGNHNLSVADVDADGRDEILYGACAFDDDGSMLYRVGLGLGAGTGIGHGDAMHVSDLDPNRPGLEAYVVHEDKLAYGYEMHDAKTGEVLWGEATGTDVGRGMSGDIDPNYPGFESWCGNAVYSCTGELITTTKPGSINFRIYWDGDLQDELLDYTKVQKWIPSGPRTNTVIDFSSVGAASINTTKANPCLSADILGDWREEVFYYNKNNKSQLLLFSTTTPTTHRLFTLMHDPVYRLAVAWQNTSYNQPPHLGFYIGDGVDNVAKPDISTAPIANSVSETKEKKEYKIFRTESGSFRVLSQNEILSLSVYSLNGSLLEYFSNLNTTDYNFSLSDLNHYFLLKIETENGVVVEKIVK